MLIDSVTGWLCSERHRRDRQTLLPMDRLRNVLSLPFKNLHSGSTGGTLAWFCSIGQQRSVLVAVAGAPNAGKSTLVNALTGRKVSATSGKTNTTFRTQMGYFQEGNVQVVLYDTPGLIERGQYRDQKHGERVESAWGIAGRCNLALLVLDAHRQVCSNAKGGKRRFRNRKSGGKRAPSQPQAVLTRLVRPARLPVRAS